MVNMPSDNAQPGLVTEVFSFERGFARIFTEGLASKQAGRQAGSHLSRRHQASRATRDSVPRPNAERSFCFLPSSSKEKR